MAFFPCKARQNNLTLVSNFFFLSLDQRLMIPDVYCNRDFFPFLACITALLVPILHRIQCTMLDIPTTSRTAEKWQSLIINGQRTGFPMNHEPTSSTAESDRAYTSIIYLLTFIEELIWSHRGLNKTSASLFPLDSLPCCQVRGASIAIIA